MTSTAPDRDPVRHNQTLSADELRTEATQALEVSGRTQSSVAKEIGVSPAAVSRAVGQKDDASRYASVLSRIIALLTDYTVEDETPPPAYRVTRKAAEA